MSPMFTSNFERPAGLVMIDPNCAIKVANAVLAWASGKLRDELTALSNQEIESRVKYNRWRFQWAKRSTDAIIVEQELRKNGQWQACGEKYRETLRVGVDILPYAMAARLANKATVELNEQDWACYLRTFTRHCQSQAVAQ